jgi:hypothetical protein
MMLFTRVFFSSKTVRPRGKNHQISLEPRFFKNQMISIALSAGTRLSLRRKKTTQAGLQKIPACAE